MCVGRTVAFGMFSVKNNTFFVQLAKCWQQIDCLNSGKKMFRSGNFVRFAARASVSVYLVRGIEGGSIRGVIATLVSE